MITGEFFKNRSPASWCSNTSLENIKFAISHFHALAQCRDFMQKQKIKPILGTDTAGSAEDLFKTSLKVLQQLPPRLQQRFMT